MRAFASLFLVLAASMSRADGAGPNYKFTTAHPPLLKTFGMSVVSINPTSVMMPVGRPFSWSTSESHKSRSRHWHSGTWPFARYHITDYYVTSNRKFTISRYLVWVIIDPPLHTNAQEVIKIVEKRGYSRSERDQLVQSLSAKAGGDAFGLSIEAAYSINLTKEDTQFWQEEQTREQDKTLSAKTDYDVWQLLDVIQLDESVQSSEAADRPRSAIGPWEPQQHLLKVVKSTWEDDAPDRNPAFAAQAPNSPPSTLETASKILLSIDESASK